MKNFIKISNLQTLALCLILGTGLLFSSCSKESNFENDNLDASTILVSDSGSATNRSLSTTPSFTIYDQIAIFNNKSDAHYAIAYFESLDSDSLINFCESVGFYSQLYILQKILKDEEVKEYSIVEPYIRLGYTDEQIEALNLTIPKSDSYTDALNRGLLTVEEDSDTAHIYSLSLWNPGLSSIIDGNGYVMIDDTLWQYKDDVFKLCTTCDISQKNTLNVATVSNNDGSIIAFSKTAANCNYWNGNTNKAFQPTGNNKRARYRRYGESCINDDCSLCFMTVQFYLHTEAQQKKWGNWKYRNSYRPTFRFDDSQWTGGAGYANCNGSGGTSTLDISNFVVPIGVTSFPMVNRTWFGNNGKAVKLHNHSNGQWPHPNNKCWVAPMQVSPTSINDMDGKIVGGTDLIDG